MKTIVADTETNGLLPELTKLHSLTYYVVEEDRSVSCTNSSNAEKYKSIEEGLAELAEADMIIGHNFIKFDIPAITKVYPWFKLKPGCIVRDTLIMARVLLPEITKTDLSLVAKGQLPRKLTGRYSLEAFGYRLGEFKGDYTGGWVTWTPEMQDYAEQDIVVGTGLWRKLLEIQAKHGVPDYVIQLEHDVAEIVLRQEQNGVGFDVAMAAQLYTEMIGRRHELETLLAAAFPNWEVRTPFIPKANNKTRGYVKGQLTHKVKIVEFNPSSRQHIAAVLQKKYRWQPVEFTDSGEAKVDDDILSALPYSEAKLLGEYLMIQKRIGQLAEGNEAWLRREKNGRIHGSVITNGAVTGRMTHMRPNLAQAPTNHVPWGARCRELFVPRAGWVQVGADADALELRCLAHYMALYDGGAYIETVLKGDKSKGTDMHSVNCRALGMDPTKQYSVGAITMSGRDIAKIWFYAFIYGAGNYKLALIRGYTGDKEAIAKKAGRDRRRLLTNLPALGKLIEMVQAKVAASGALRGIDGRRLSIRAQHSALNTLLQSAGAIAMKVALVKLDRALQALGLIPGVDYEFMLNIHDEWQLECRPDIAVQVGEAAAQAIRDAGAELKFRCPLDGQFKQGRSWKDTH